MSSLRTPHVSASLAGLLAVVAALLVPARAQATTRTTTAGSVQARVDRALRGIGASHVDYRFSISGVGVLNRNSTAQIAPASNEKIFTTIASCRQ